MTFWRMSLALAVQTKGFGFRSCAAMWLPVAEIGPGMPRKTPLSLGVSRSIWRGTRVARYAVERPRSRSARRFDSLLVARIDRRALIHHYAP
jgi:hypothetical protein